MLAVGGQRLLALDRLWRHQAHDPPGQQRVVAEAAGHAEIVRIENFDQGRRFHAVGICDAAVILVVFTVSSLSTPAMNLTTSSVED